MTMWLEIDFLQTISAYPQQFLINFCACIVIDNNVITINAYVSYKYLCNSCNATQNVLIIFLSQHTYVYAWFARNLSTIN